MTEINPFSIEQPQDFTNPFNCAGLDRSVCHHRNMGGIMIVVCALMCHGTQR